MNTTHTNEPTEPNAKSMEGRLLETISLRDYFAAKAMQSTLADDAYLERTETPSEWVAIVAKASYEIADAMLKAREA